MDVSKYRDIFFSEAREHLTLLNGALVRQEKGGDFSVAVNDLFRSVHTIKGMSAAMGFQPLADLAHDLEGLLDCLRSVLPTQEDMDLLFMSFDGLEALIGSAEKEETLSPPGDLVRQVKSRVNALRSGGALDPRRQETTPAVAQSSVVPVDDGIPACRVIVSLDEGCAFKIARAMVVIGTLDSMGRVLKCDPEVGQADEGDFEGRFTVYFQCAELQEKIKDVVLSVPEVAGVIVLPFEEQSDLKASEGADAATLGRKESLNRAFVAKETIRVNVRHLEALMAVTEMLVMDRAALSRLAEQKRDKPLERLVLGLSRDLADLQFEVMQTRMVPASEILDRFPRMVRDLAKDLGKEVDLVCEGKETEFDRSLLEHLGDPLVHLLRNSIHHGFESPEERLAMGKPRRGAVYIEARRERNNVLFIVEDDGRGIDRDAVLRKAISLGLVGDVEAPTLSQEDIIELITKPGFSTATEVTEISGRGVGLDVVRHSIRALGGTLNIESVWGKGTRCIMSLPVTLAIIRALLVEVGGEEYAIPLGNVLGVLAARQSDMRLVNNQWMLPQEDSVLPLVIMEDAFSVPSPRRANGKPRAVVLVGVGTRRSGLVFDHLIEQQDIVVKGLGELLRRVEGFSGVTIGGDGRPILILDVASFI